MSYSLRDHTADVAVEATGETPSALFGAVADGLAAAMCESVPDAGDRFTVTVEAESLEALLFDYLGELIYERDVRGVLPVDNEAAVERGDPAARGAAADEDEAEVEGGDGDTLAWRVDATARGVPLDAVRAREVKAVTYSEMAVEETPDGWRAYVVFDV